MFHRLKQQRVIKLQRKLSVQISRVQEDLADHEAQLEVMNRVCKVEHYLHDQDELVRLSGMVARQEVQLNFLQERMKAVTEQLKEIS